MVGLDTATYRERPRNVFREQRACAARAFRIVEPKSQDDAREGGC